MLAMTNPTSPGPRDSTSLGCGEKTPTFWISKVLPVDIREIFCPTASLPSNILARMTTPW